MKRDLREEAISGLRLLHNAAAAIEWQYVADWIGRATAVIESDDSSCKEKLEEVIGVCGGLGRGEWSRSLEAGGLSYWALFEVPLALYRYCETLSLDQSQMSFVRNQIAKLERAHEFQRTEQASASDRDNAPNSIRASGARSDGL